MPFPSSIPDSSSWPHHFNISAQYLLNFLKTIEALGIDVNRLLADVGISKSTLTDPGARVRDDQKLVIWERAATALAKADLGLLVGETAPLGRWGLVEQLIFHSSTLREGFEASIRFSSLMANGKRLRLDSIGTTATYTMNTESAPPVPVPAGWRHLIESELAYTIRLIRLIVSPAFTPLEVWFTHAKPMGVEQTTYTRLLGPTIKFDQPTNAVVFDAQWLDASIISALPQLKIPLELEAARSFEQMLSQQRVALKVEAFIRLDPESITIADIAERLHISPRTLQRRLAEENTSFNSVLESVRCEYAKTFLADSSMSMSEVSYRLGFSEPSALFRAAKRWFGMTAQSYREAAQKEPQ